MNTNQSRFIVYSTISALVFVAVFLMALAIGRYSLSFQDVIDFLTGSLSHSSNEYKVINDLRLPRTIIAALVGIGLSISGLLYQETFQNPLVSPDLLGVTSGASVGAALAILLVAPASPVTPVFVGLSAGIIGSRFLLFFIKLSRHCQRGTSQSTYFLGWETGIALGLCLGYACFYEQPTTLIYTALGITAVALVLYHFFTHSWFLKHKNR